MTVISLAVDVLQGGLDALAGEQEKLKEKKILITTRSLLVIPQMDLAYNLKALAEWDKKLIAEKINVK